MLSFSGQLVLVVALGFGGAYVRNSFLYRRGMHFYESTSSREGERGPPQESPYNVTRRLGVTEQCWRSRGPKRAGRLDEGLVEPALAAVKKRPRLPRGAEGQRGHPSTSHRQT